MTYANGNPAPPAAGAKLANRNWRYLNSWWIFPPILSFGFFCWLGFLVAAIRTGKRAYWVFTVVYTLTFATFITLVSISDGSADLASNLAILPFLVAWIGPTVHAAVWNRRYLTTLAGQSVWHQVQSPQVDYPATTDQAPVYGVSQSDYYASGATPSTPHRNMPDDRETTGTAAQWPPPAQGAHTYPEQPTPYKAATPDQSRNLLNPNTATTEAFSELPGVSPALAYRIVSVRDAQGGYRDMDDLTSAANLQPHEVVRLRNHLTFDNVKDAEQPQRKDETQRGPTGRILDI